MSAKAARPSDGSDAQDWIFERNFALRFFEAVNTPVAQSAHMRLSGNKPSSACELSVDPRHYQEPKHFAEDYQVAEILKKSHNIPGYTEDVREAEALRKFLSAEERNAETNARLWGDRLPDWFGSFSNWVLTVLGPLDAKTLEVISELGEFGPGTNVGVRSEGLVPSIKYEAKPVCTPLMQPLLRGVIPPYVKTYWHDASQVAVVEGNSHFTVPKNYKVKRCAAKEPVWNSYIQAGAGGYMVKRLKRFGVDLHDQRLNQILASMAGDWGLATIDLSSASDLMARVLVLLALTYNRDPQGVRWHHLLNSIRSPSMKIGKDHRVLEMFSSMGNGFTFPLETILFLAVIRCTVPREDWCVCTAYGDDIIVPQAYARQVVERLEYLGFKVNGEKTCLAGTFFESCGTDWFNGCNVRPFYLHKDPENPAPYPLAAANALRAWCLRVYGCLPQKFSSLWHWCKGQVPAVWRNPVPSGLGDVGLHTSLLVGMKAGVVSAHCAGYVGWEGYHVKGAKVAPVRKDRCSFGVLACGLSSQHRTWAFWGDAPFGSAGFSGGLEAVRGLYGRVRTEWHVVLWEDDFDWEV